MSISTRSSMAYRVVAIRANGSRKILTHWPLTLQEATTVVKTLGDVPHDVYTRIEIEHETPAVRDAPQA